MTEQHSPDVIKGSCPECEAERFAEVVAIHTETWHDREAGIGGDNTYRILRCRGCETVYFQKDEVFSEDFDTRRNHITGTWEQIPHHKLSYWPVASSHLPAWSIELHIVNGTLGQLYDDLHSALDASLPVFAAIGIRTVFDAASELFGIDPEKTFAQKILDLAGQGKIGADEAEILAVLIDAGGAAAHRGWRPSQEELNTLLQVIDAFLYRSFILVDRVKRLKSTVPKRPGRGKPTS